MSGYAKSSISGAALVHGVGHFIGDLNLEWFQHLSSAGLLDCFCVENCDGCAAEVGCGGSHGDHRGGLNFDAFLRY